MKIHVKKGTTSKLLTFFVADSTSTYGNGLTGVLYNSSGLTAYYYREGAGSTTAITLATMTPGTWATGGFIELDRTNMPGFYQLGIPDAALASGASDVVIMIRGATYMVPVLIELQLVNPDFDNGINFGLTALPAVAAGASGGLLINEYIVDSVNDVSPTASSFKGTNSLSSSDSFYTKSILVFTSGTLKGLGRTVTGYTGSTRLLSFSAAFPTAPSNSDTFILIGHVD